MKYIHLITLTALLMLVNCTEGHAQNKANDKINIGLGYPLVINGKNAIRDTNCFSLVALVSISSSERGVSIAGISNIVKNDTKGLQIAGVSNHIYKNAGGTMIAGLLNTYSSGNALSLAGVANIARAKSGPQVSGLINKSSGISSLQISGFLNVAKKVKGFQLSLINVADTANTQIGLINISRNGNKAFTISVDENQTTMIAFRSGGKTLYGIIGLGYNLKIKQDKYAIEAGLGIHLVNMKSFQLNSELVSNGLQGFEGNEYYKSSIRLIPMVRIVPGVSLFAGPSFNYFSTNSEEGKNMNHNLVSNWTGNNGRNLYGFYFGYNIGIQIYF